MYKAAFHLMEGKTRKKTKKKKGKSLTVADLFIFFPRNQPQARKEENLKQLKPSSAATFFHKTHQLTSSEKRKARREKEREEVQYKS